MTVAVTERTTIARPVRVAFLTQDLQLSGGVGVVVEHASRLAVDHGFDVTLVHTLERHDVEWVDDSAESYARFMEDSFPPLVAARAAVGDDRVHEVYLAFLEDANEAGDGGFSFRGEYLLSVVDV